MIYEQKAIVNYIILIRYWNGNSDLCIIVEHAYFNIDNGMRAFVYELMRQQCERDFVLFVCEQCQKKNRKEEVEREKVAATKAMILIHTFDVKSDTPQGKMRAAIEKPLYYKNGKQVKVHIDLQADDGLHFIVLVKLQL